VRNPRHIQRCLLITYVLSADSFRLLCCIMPCECSGLFFVPPGIKTRIWVHNKKPCTYKGTKIVLTITLLDSVCPFTISIIPSMTKKQTSQFVVKSRRATTHDPHQPCHIRSVVMPPPCHIRSVVMPPPCHIRSVVMPPGAIRNLREMPPSSKCMQLGCLSTESDQIKKIKAPSRRPPPRKFIDKIANLDSFGGCNPTFVKE